MIARDRSWRNATLLLVILSLIVFVIQRTSLAVFDTVFELCIFHIPALFSAVVNFWSQK